MPIYRFYDIHLTFSFFDRPIDCGWYFADSGMKFRDLDKNFQYRSKSILRNKSFSVGFL